MSFSLTVWTTWRLYTTITAPTYTPVERVLSTPPVPLSRWDTGWRWGMYKTQPTRHSLCNSVTRKSKNIIQCLYLFSSAENKMFQTQKLQSSANQFSLYSVYSKIKLTPQFIEGLCKCNHNVKSLPSCVHQDHVFRIDPSKVEDGKGKSPYDPRHNAASVLVGNWTHAN